MWWSEGGKHIGPLINMAIVSRVADLLKSKGWTQKDLAKAMDKSESEISKWLSGMHNLTLKSIALMETALDADILIVAEHINDSAAQHETSSPLPNASDK